MHTAIVKKCDFIAHETLEIILESTIPFSFLPGQYITILCPTKDGKRIGRSYSIASFKEERHIILVVRLIKEGIASTYFETLKTGDSISFIGPIGKFLINQDTHNSLFIATGTGLAPFMPMMEQLLISKKEINIDLILGFRYEKEIFYKEKLDLLMKQNKKFSYFLSLSRPEENWKGLTGRVTEILKQSPHISLQRKIYICGNGSMVKDVQSLCLDLGNIPENILFEKYNNL